jgi:uncharacterized membrane protein
VTRSINDTISQAFFNELRRLEYVEGDNLLIERFSGEGRAAYFPDLAQDVVRRKPDVVISITTFLTLDFKAATTTIPIVGNFGYPVEAGVVSSLPYPPPEAIERYEKILPGSFNRILTMVENLQQAQIDQSRSAANYARQDIRRGHWLGWSLSVLAFGCALASLYLANPWVAVAFLSLPVMTVAKALIDTVRAQSPQTQTLPQPKADRTTSPTEGVPANQNPTAQ